MITRDSLLEYIAQKYHTIPEYLWTSAPEYAVLRHKKNRKWYAIIMNVTPDKVGLQGMDLIDILDIKGDPDMIATLISQKGFYPAYHMNKQHWITIVLDGTVSDETIYQMLDISYELTK